MGWPQEEPISKKETRHVRQSSVAAVSNTDEHMVTIFTTPKPFVGHSAVIQRNALKSWTLLDPDVEVILFGDEQGAAEATRDLGVRHVPEVERTPRGYQDSSFFL